MPPLILGAKKHGQHISGHHSGSGISHIYGIYRATTQTMNAYKSMHIRSFSLSRLTMTVFSAVLILLSGCQKADEAPIKVGILHSLTGTMAISEKPVVDATLLAIEEINANGGLLGRKLVPVILDGKSHPPIFASQAERLIRDEKVAVIFGCWTSASRKTVKPIVEKYENLLFYPVQDEGMEFSPHIIYTGEVPSQQIIPAISWASENLGKRLYLIGSNYIFPRVANWLIRKQAALLGMQIVGESYQPLGSTDFSATAAEITRLKPDVVINTINGDSNISFFKTMYEAGLRAETTPVLSFSIGENELLGMPPEHTIGHYAAASYFQSIDSIDNRSFVRAFKTRYGRQRVLSDAMEAAYIGVKLWSKAVSLTDSTDAIMILSTIKTLSMQAPEGVIAMGLSSQHTWRHMRVGRINNKRQFDIIWKSDDMFRPDPYPLKILRDDAIEMNQRIYHQWDQSWEAPPVHKHEHH